MERARFRPLLAIVILAILFLVILALYSRPAEDSNRENTTPSPTTQTQSPDKVKSENGPNMDTAPSSTGTGPGSNNSLLGPNP